MDSEPTDAADAFPYNSPARYRYLTPRERRILERHNRRQIDTLINVGPGGITLDSSVHPLWATVGIIGLGLYAWYIFKTTHKF